jgi:AmmeMemoRadiSam system protein B/AmmeMemoRadiSam system protein A
VAFLVTAIVGVALAVGSSPSERGSRDRVRKPAVAGSFYPHQPEKLRETVLESLKSARKEQFTEPVRAIIAPHAGYYYCGRSLASAYKQIEGASFTYDTVVLIGPSHRVATKAAALSSADSWETPLGPVPVDTRLSRRFVEQSSRLEFDDGAHLEEHSLEVQLPYLLAAADRKPFKIVPLLMNSPDPMDHELVARTLVELAANPRTLLVVSTDLSHYPTANAAEKVDRRILDAVCSLNAQTIVEENRKLMKEGYPGLSVTMCGLPAVLCLALAAKGLGVTQAKVVSYTHSGMVAGDNQRVVGYGAVVFTGSGKGASNKESDPMMITFSNESRQELIRMAAAAVRAAVEGEWVSYDPTDNPELQARAGCFVTLKNKGVLRGCIGRFTSDDPLWKTVREIAISSATRDERFMLDPIKPSEVPHLEIEISVLSPMRRVRDPMKEIQLGSDGIVIEDQGRSGTFLPQVATETGWSLEEFLGHCSRDKAGLGWEGWKNPRARIYSYTVTIIQDEKTHRGNR